MPRLVTKFKYIKPGSGGKPMGGYAKYIATREGVEKIDDSQRHAPATIKQQELIMRILRDFPDTKESHEYEDYRREKTVGNASEFITRALEENMDRVADSKTYADYIATRPRAERFGSHGLFTDDGVQIQLSKVSKELNEYTGHVYTTILSLRREDAARLGFDNGSRWRDFLRSHTKTISENLKIPMDHLKWYAAYHDEGHHPHVHMIAYSCMPGEGHLSKQGVEKMRSVFATDIFAQDMMHIYEHQTGYRNQLREQGRDAVAELVAQIETGHYRNSRVEQLLVSLSDRLSRTSGKKVYGYLKADVKVIVDQIVAELATDERIQKLYELWYEQREEVLRSYTDHFPKRIPLEQNKEFKTIRNAVIQEALKITTQIEQAASAPAGTSTVTENPQYWSERMRTLPCLPDRENDNETVLGNVKETVEPTIGNFSPAQRIEHKKYDMEQIAKTIQKFQKAAENGNSFAEYQLGRIYYFGNGARVDQEKGLEYLKESAAHGNEYAANLLLTIQQQHTWGVASCTASLIAQLGRIFQEQDQKQSQCQRPRMDRKHRREIEEKKQALGIRD